MAQVIENAGKDRFPGKNFPVDALQFQIENSAICVRSESRPLIEVNTGASDCLVGEVAGKRFAGVAMNQLKGVDEGSFGVEDQTVEIKDERANHEEVENEPTEMARQKNQLPGTARSRRKYK